MTSNNKSYELAGGLSPSGRCRFSDDEVRAVGTYCGNVRVTLKSGQVLIVSSRHQPELERLVS